MSISTPFIQRPVATTLLLIAVALVGSHRVSAAAGFAAAAGGFSDHQRERFAARRKPAGDGGFGGDASREKVHAHRRRDGDDVEQFDRVGERDAAIRSEPRYQRGGARCAGGYQRGCAESAGEPAD